MQEIALGYQDGSDRLLLRFPQLVMHAITPDSPLGKWALQRTSPSYASELVIVVEGIIFCNSSNMSRTISYQLPADLKLDHYFAPMVSAPASVAAVPPTDWRAFHAVLPVGQVWNASAAPTDLTSGLGSWMPSRPRPSMPAVHPGNREVEMTDASAVSAGQASAHGASA
jgi:hypothetical protein